jgi:hypothetical protein
MIIAAASLLVLAWLPGAVLFRLPIAERERRAALPAEERLFWQVVLSLCLTLTIAIGLAAVHRYSFARVLAADVLVAAGLAAGARFRLRTAAPRPTASALIVAALVVLGVWRFFPPAEYIMGGKDPGTYVNEGVLMAQRGTLVYRDPLIAAVPPGARELFFPAKREEAGHFGTRFMGFPILDLDAGLVVGQFPHLFPASIALGYGVDGLTGVRHVGGAWAVLGLVAFYLAASRLAGRTAAAAAAALLAIHVIEVWFARYPNAEVAMQALLFAALLANARAHVDGDRFFAPVAALLLVLLLFLRIDAVLAIAAMVAANLLGSLRGSRLHPSFLAVLAAGGATACVYFLGPMRQYAFYPTQFVLNLQPLHLLLLAGGALLLFGALYAGRRWPAAAAAVTSAVPIAVGAVLFVLAIYALFLRQPEGKLALENAWALRMYASFYVTVPAVFAALIGFTLLARTAFWRDPALLLTIAVFSIFFFYKIRIVPEHFWAARRFLPVILPGTLLLACAAATWGLRQAGARRLASAAIGAVFLVLIAQRYVSGAAPILDHVEYAGIIPELEGLAGRIKDDELLLVESRDAGSDSHVFALPLGYIYARNVLVLSSARPDRASFGLFLDWARARYSRVYFLGSGGTDLLSRHWRAHVVESRRFQVPEYESALNAYPRSVRHKEFDFGLYELQPAAAADPSGFDLDVGVGDDLHVVRFHAKEQSSGRTMRWTQRQSFVSIPVFPAEGRELVIEMSSGGRPPAAPPADVRVELNDRELGAARVGDGFTAYTFAIPADLAAAIVRSDQPARLRLLTTVWNPHEVIGSPDDRQLGVMVDRVRVR